MGITLEEVERLRQKSGASFEDCKDALERSGGDLLDAIIYLEKTGKCGSAGKTASYTTKPTESTAEAVKRVLAQPAQSAKGKQKKENEKDWHEVLREILDMGANLLRHSTVNQLEVWRHDKLMTSIPVLILVLLMVLAFWVTIPLLILGLFIGCRYRFVGPDLGKEKINDVMDNVSATVDDMVGQVKREFEKDKKKTKNPRDGADKAGRRVDEFVDQLDSMVDELDDALSGEKKK